MPAPFPALRPPALPSLNALLAFEVAARHLSFTRAAKELGVTQTAISHQVRALENELGFPLFRRSPHHISLTREGQAWAAELSVVFTRLRDANRNLRHFEEASRPAVSVSVIPSFASRWLVPRLGRFLVEYAEVDVRISATERLVDFAVEPVDVGIRYGAGGYSGLVATKLADDAFVVVAAPAAAGKRARWAPADLGSEVLLHDDYPDAWGRWFGIAGVKPAAQGRRTQYTDSAMVVEAAIRGQGVALARWSLVVDELALGRLRLLFPKFPPVPTGLGYYVVCPRENTRRKPVADFIAWVRGEAMNLKVPAGG
jgi:LysR family transcriptional regulator, glycine cleavage system transcriptional activator